jgi:nucleoside-diphosphate-sugar epimerase
MGAACAVLVRARGGRSGESRAREAGLRGPVVEGEVGGHLGELGAYDTVIHCAGDTTFFPKDVAAYRRCHVDGAVALLARTRPRVFVYVSTAFVCGTRTGTAMEDEARVGQGFHNPYEETKLLAEEALRAAAGGVDLRIVRPSIVVGDAPPTAGGGPTEKVYGFIRLMRDLGWGSGGFREQVRVYGVKAARFNMVPVEYVADGIVALAHAPEAAHGTFHLVAAAPCQEELFATIAERAGLPGLRVVERRFRSPSAVEAAIHAGFGRYQEYLRHHVTFDDRWARAILGPRGIPRPSLEGGELAAFVDRVLESRG